MPLKELVPWNSVLTMNLCPGAPLPRQPQAEETTPRLSNFWDTAGPHWATQPMPPFVCCPGPRPVRILSTRSNHKKNETDFQQKCPSLWLTALLSRAFSISWGQQVHLPFYWVTGPHILGGLQGWASTLQGSNAGNKGRWGGRVGRRQRAVTEHSQGDKHCVGTFTK